MSTPRYFPIVEIDTHGEWMVSMFASTDKQTVAKTRAYLEEVTPRSFRLVTKGQLSLDCHIGCPYCGKKLECIVHENEGVEHSLYQCSCRT